MIITDGKVITLTDENGSHEVVAVGWLGCSPFPTAEPAPDFVEALFDACTVRVRQTRGFYDCEFCPQVHPSDIEGPLKVERGGQEIYLGSAEIEIVAEHGYVYAAPTLIYHYVTCHNYAPPPGFIGAAIRRYELISNEKSGQD